MASIKPTISDVSQDGSVMSVRWAAITNTDTDGQPVVSIEWADRCVQVSGTFGGTSMSIYGSNDGTNWYILNNAQGTAATFTAAGMKQIVEVPYFIKPMLTGGSGASVDVTLIARRANSMRT